MKNQFSRFIQRRLDYIFLSHSVQESVPNIDVYYEFLKITRVNLCGKNNEYNVCKENLNIIYDEIANGIKIRSRCNWYELGKKSNKFILDLEKYQANHNTIKKVIHDAQEITDHKKINNHIFLFYKKLFEEKLQNDIKKTFKFLKDILIPSVTVKQKKICEGELTEKKSSTSMENNKSPATGGVTRVLMHFLG